MLAKKLLYPLQSFWGVEEQSSGCEILALEAVSVLRANKVDLLLDVAGGKLKNGNIIFDDFLGQLIRRDIDDANVGLYRSEYAGDLAVLSLR